MKLMKTEDFLLRKEKKLQEHELFHWSLKRKRWKRLLR